MMFISTLCVMMFIIMLLHLLFSGFITPFYFFHPCFWGSRTLCSGSGGRRPASLGMLRSLSRALLAAPLVVLLAVPKTRRFLRDILAELLAVPKTRGAASIPDGPAPARREELQQCTPTAPEAGDGPGTRPAPGTGGGHDLFPEWLTLAGGSTLADVTTPTSSIGKGDALIVIDMQRDFVPGVLQPACPCARQTRSTLTLYAA